MNQQHQQKRSGLGFVIVGINFLPTKSNANRIK